jgi:Predicted amidohydrolase
VSTPKAAVIQLRSGGDVSRNLARIETLLKQAAEQGAALALLPENCSHFGARERDKLAVAEADGSGPIQDRLADIARRVGLWVVAGSVPLRVDGDDARVHAACLVYDERGERRARYDKIHLFDVEVPGGQRYHESASIAAGPTRVVTLDSPVGRLGLSVCYDLRFPELYRALSAAGAEVLCVPSAFTVPTGRAHWNALLAARAIENQCYVLAAAQQGSHPNGRETYGHSLIFDPWGERLAMRPRGEGVALAELSSTRLAEVRSRFPALSHRRM